MGAEGFITADDNYSHTDIIAKRQRIFSQPNLVKSYSLPYRIEIDVTNGNTGDLRNLDFLITSYVHRKRKIGAGDLSGDIKTALITHWCDEAYKAIFSSHQSS